MSEDTKRLRDAADIMHADRYLLTSKAQRDFLAAVGDWLESTAHRAGHTTRGIDLDHARKVADAILGYTPPTRKGRP